MAPKTAASLSRQLSKEKPENKTPTSDEEEEEVEEEDDETEEEVEEDDETEEGSSSEDEDTDLQKVEKNIKTPIPVMKFESEPIAQEDGSDSDLDSDGSPSDYKLQPIPKPSSTSAKRAKPSSTSAKRACEEGAGEEGNAFALGSRKKSKVEEKKSSSVGGSTRVWSNENEITVLNQMIQFRNTEQVDPTSDMLAFYDSVKGKLQGDFSKEQLKTKISGLKKRFLNAMKKGQNGADPVFSKPHDDRVFELSKKIWGGNGEGGGKKIENNANAEKNAKGNNAEKGKERKKDNARGKEAKKGKEVVAYEKEVVKEENGVMELDFWSEYKSIRESFGNLAVKFPSLAMSETWMRSVMEKLCLIGNADAKQLNDKWKKLIIEETELNYKMMILMNEQLKMAFGQ